MIKISNENRRNLNDEQLRKPDSMERAEDDYNSGMTVEEVQEYFLDYDASKTLSQYGLRG